MNTGQTLNVFSKGVSTKVKWAMSSVFELDMACLVCSIDWILKTPFFILQEDVSDVDVNKEMDKLRTLMQEKRAGTLCDVSEDELEQYTNKMPEDKVFKKFNKRIARHPEQVLRYDKGGSPLWITGNTENLIQIPNCQYCGGERQFEFQVSTYPSFYKVKSVVILFFNAILLNIYFYITWKQ